MAELLFSGKPIEEIGPAGASHLPVPCPIHTHRDRYSLRPPCAFEYPPTPITPLFPNPINNLRANLLTRALSWDRDAPQARLDWVRLFLCRHRRQPAQTEALPRSKTRIGFAFSNTPATPNLFPLSEIESGSPFQIRHPKTALASLFRPSLFQFPKIRSLASALTRRVSPKRSVSSLSEPATQMILEPVKARLNRLNTLIT